MRLIAFVLVICVGFCYYDAFGVCGFLVCDVIVVCWL